MEENPSSTILDGQIVGIRFGLATHKEICTASISDCPISHASQLSNPFLGLPLAFGKCESCGTSEPGKCEGHFGYIELPIPIYHPSHISELKRLLSLLCLKCLKLKTKKFPTKDNGIAQRLLSSCCEDASLVSVGEIKTTDGACHLQLKLPSKFRLSYGFWNFLERYGFRYGDSLTRTLLPCEVKEILKRIPAETRKKLAAKGHFPQDGYILEYLPVPPNCLSVPDISDGVSIMSSDLSLSMLKKVLKQVEIIKSSRSGTPNFESQEVEADELQLAVGQYLEVRGTAKASRDIDARFGVSQDSNSSTKAWLEKMRTLFIRKGSGFSSRSVITGDSYKRVNEIGIPFEIAQRITFEERVNVHNMKYLQDLVDKKLCLTYGDGSYRYSLREGSKGHTFLRLGQVVHRRIMDGDIVFVNRPPTTHKHSLQALSVYVHDDHTVKINPLICGPLSADFDGDCIHLFYPQSLAAKAEVLELFSVEKQLLSSHSGNLNLQMATDALLSLKLLFKKYLLNKAVSQQLAMFVSSPLPPPALLKGNYCGSHWTASQILQTVLPDYFDCCGDRYLIRKSEVLEVDFNRDMIQSLINEIVTSIFFEKGPVEVLEFFDSLQPLLMENLVLEGFSVGLEDFFMSKSALHKIEKDFQEISPLLYRLRSKHNEMAELQLEAAIRRAKAPVANFILKLSALGDLIDSKSDSAVSKVVQQIGFLGLQLLDKGKFYSKTLFEDVASHFQCKYPLDINYPSAKFGLIKGSFFHGLDPYEEMVHSISTREVIVRSSRGLSEPGTLFKNLMAVLRDVVICYDGTVRNVCSNSIIQFEYGMNAGSKPQSLLPAGEPVGVLAATAMSNPAYKAVLDSSPSSNSSWELMKEILLCKVSFNNDLIDRRVILYLNDCHCGRKYCHERAALMVESQLKRVSLKDTAVDFLIEYKRDRTVPENLETDAGLVAHVHLNEMWLKELEITMQEVLLKCRETLKSSCKKKKLKKYVHYFKHTFLSVSECCLFQQSCADDCSNMPCLMFFFQDASESHLDKVSYILANMIYPVLSETIIKGDPRISSANIIWISPDTTTWIRNPSKTQKGELALDVVLEKSVVKQSGDAWRIVLDSCLPVLHLIDTRRSVPYAIKQVQELLGIACAFEQAVQRLSTSVTMVAKGVRKEHLILLANSMTCAGNLVGFNSGGYKALSRSLSVQVPFTEATLFTPRKCFEKAAEKCHVDNLSSVVASCSWGKHVAVGTGSKFDILWDTKVVGLDQENKIEVYNFLNMVRSSTGVEELNTDCLGAEVDDLEMDDEMADWNLSPEKDSSLDKPVFEDSAEFQNGVDDQLGGLNWEKDSPSNRSAGGGDWGRDKLAKSDSWSSWSKDEIQDKSANSDSWSSWSKDETKDKSAKPDFWHSWQKNENQDALAKPDSRSCWKKDETQDGPTTRRHKESSKSSSWDSVVDRAEDKFDRIESCVSKPWSGWSSANDSSQPAKGGNDSSWGQGKSSHGWGSVDDSSHPAKDGNDTSWEQQKSSEISHGWGSANDSSQAARGGNDSSWGQPKSSEVSHGRGSVYDSSQPTKGGNDSSCGQKKSSEVSDGWGSVNDSRHPAKGGNDNSLGRQKSSQVSYSWASTNDSSGNDSSWGQQKSLEVSPGWGTTNDSSQAGKGGSDNSWGEKKLSEVSPGWGSTNDSTQQAKGGNDSFWVQQKSSEVSQGSGSGNDSTQPAKVGNDSSWGQQKSSEVSHGWGSANDSTQPVKGGNVSSWGQQKSSDVSHGWGSANDSTQLAKAGNDSSWGHDVKSGNDSSWGLQKSSDASIGWGLAEDSNHPASSNSWELPNTRVDKESEKNQWGQPGAIWKGKKKNRPPRSPAASDSVVAGLYTVTRQRLDMFTSEEQAILEDVEPIMQSIRRIMHLSGYNDGDLLSVDDKTFIVDNVFNYHPDKEAKMGAGIDHLMVNKHSSFQESRCFYVVSTDGRSQDFSYRKCLDSFIRGKYPDLADEFLGKYFRKPRAGGNRERSLPPVPEENKE